MKKNQGLKLFRLEGVLQTLQGSMVLSWQFLKWQIFHKSIHIKRFRMLSTFASKYIACDNLSVRVITL